MTVYENLIDEFEQSQKLTSGEKQKARAALQSAIEAMQATATVREGQADHWQRVAREAQAERDALQAKLDDLEKQEPVQFLADATRFKLTFDAKGRVSTMWAHMEKLEGRWVALVAAEDDCHLKLAAPKALAPLTQPEVVEAFCNTRHNTQYVSVFDAGVRFAEKHHGIGGTP